MAIEVLLRSNVEDAETKLIFRFCNECKECVVSSSRIAGAYVIDPQYRAGCMEIGQHICIDTIHMHYHLSGYGLLDIVVEAINVPEIRLRCDPLTGDPAQLTIITRGSYNLLDAAHFDINQTLMTSAIEALCEAGVFRRVDEPGCNTLDWCDEIWKT